MPHAYTFRSVVLALIASLLALPALAQQDGWRPPPSYSEQKRRVQDRPVQQERPAGEYVTKGRVACFSEEDLDEFTHASVANDTAWMDSLLDSQRCFVMKRGLRARIKDFGFLVHEIYLFPPGGGRPVAVFTHSDSIGIGE